MTMIQNILLPDGQASPVTSTYIPMGRDRNGVYWWEAQAGPTVEGFLRLSCKFNRTQGPKGATRVTWTNYDPVLETLGTNDNGFLPPPTNAFVANFSSSALMDNRMTQPQIKNMRVRHLNLASMADYTSTIDLRQGPFG